MTRDTSEKKKRYYGSQSLTDLHFDIVENFLCPLNRTSHPANEGHNSMIMYTHRLDHVQQDERVVLIVHWSELFQLEV